MPPLPQFSHRPWETNGFRLLAVCLGYPLLILLLALSVAAQHVATVADGAQMQWSRGAFFDLVSQVPDVRPDEVRAASAGRVPPNALQQALGWAGFIDVQHEVTQEFEFSRREPGNPAIALNGQVPGMQHKPSRDHMVGQDGCRLMTTAQERIGPRRQFAEWTWPSNVRVSVLSEDVRFFLHLQMEAVQEHRRPAQTGRSLQSFMDFGSAEAR
jgi:hypothetical protein